MKANLDILIVLATKFGAWKKQQSKSLPVLRNSTTHGQVNKCNWQSWKIRFHLDSILIQIDKSRVIMIKGQRNNVSRVFQKQFTLGNVNVASTNYILIFSDLDSGMGFKCCGMWTKLPKLVWYEINEITSNWGFRTNPFETGKWSCLDCLAILLYLFLLHFMNILGWGGHKLKHLVITNMTPDIVTWLSISHLSHFSYF